MRHKGKIAAIAAAVVILAVAAVPFVVNVNSFRPMLEKELTAAVGRQVTLGELSLSLFSGGIVAENLAIADDPAFSTSPFLSASALRLGVEMRPLIFDHKILIRSLEIESPKIHLIHAADGVWNFSTIGQSAAARLPNMQKDSMIPGLTVDSFHIDAGHATLESLPAVGAPLVYDQVDISVQGFSFGKQFPFTLRAALPGEGTLTLNGKAGPIDAHNAAKTTFDAQLTVRHLDPVAAGFLDKNAGVTVLADVEAHTVSDGTMVSSNGTVHTQRLRLRPDGVPAPKPIDITYSVAHNLGDNTGQLQDAIFQTGKLAAHLSGSYSLASGTAVEVKMKLVGESLPIDELQGLIPAVGVKLPNGSVLQGGTLTTSLSIVGPLLDLVITGPVQLNNTRLSGFNMSKQLTGIASMAVGNTGDITNIQTLRLNLQVTKAGVTATNVYAALPAMGEVVGQGTVSPAGALNFQLSMKMDTSRGVGGKAVGLMAKLNGTSGKTAAQAAGTGVPVAITGTSANPIITPDVNGMMKSNAASILNKQKDNGKAVIGKLGGLFGKKK